MFKLYKYVICYITSMGLKLSLKLSSSGRSTYKPLPQIEIKKFNACILNINEFLN